MTMAERRSQIRGLAVSSAVLAAVIAAAVIAMAIALAPRPPVAGKDWQPPAGYTIAETVPLAGDQALRLWVGQAGWYVEGLTSGQHESAVGAASSGGTQYSMSEILGGLVGYLPIPEARTASIGTTESVQAKVHSGMFLVPATAIAVNQREVAVRPRDAHGRALAPQTLVTVLGRS